MPSLHPASKTHHLLKTACLIYLSLLFAPLITGIAILSSIISPYLKVTKQINHYRRWRQVSSSTFKPHRVLITGVGMTKGLSLCRTFYRAGHKVIGADFEPRLLPVPGHFSTAVSMFYRLSRPTRATGTAKYVGDLIDLIRAERIELWIPCSGDSMLLEDAEAAKAVERRTNCKVVQLGRRLTETLRDRYLFIENTRKLGLNVPDTRLVTSEEEALAILYPEDASGRKKWVMKAVKQDERGSRGGEVVLLPEEMREETEAEVKRLDPTPDRPYVLQEFVQGLGSCSQALIIDGKVKSFVACPSEILTHYTPLPPSSALNQAMLLYTALFVQRTDSTMTGHLSFDFLVPEDVASKVECQMDASESEIKALMERIFAVACDPKAHTAVVAFTDVSDELAEAYLGLLPTHESHGLLNGYKEAPVVMPKPRAKGYYWIGHDVATKVLLPLLKVLTMETSVTDCVKTWMEFERHASSWREATYEVWDPWPTWWMYVGYWPLVLLMRVWERRWWSRIDLATGEIFD